jgi:hypothetical protein
MLDELFSGLDSKMDFLNEQTTKINNDGIYRIDLSKVKDKKKGYRSVLRFLPNFTREGKLGQSAVEKISHYVDIKTVKELIGYYDSPKNFGGKCALTDLYYTLTNSKNAILQERAKMLNYSRKYFSYVLVIEDEQQPELVGKVMILQYGKTIKDKILAEKNGEVYDSCNVFDLSKGKDFVMIVKELNTGDITYPDYKMSMFRQETTTLPIFFKEKGVFKNVPLGEDGVVSKEHQPKIKDFLLEREHELEDFGPKKLTDEQQGKINEIISFMTGKTSTSYTQSSNDNSATSGDFEFEESFSPSTSSAKSASIDDDDFFSDM